MSQKLQESKNKGPHLKLSKLEGNWEGIARTWFDPATLEDESPVKGNMKLIMDGKYVLFEYQGSFGGKPLSGLAIHGYNLELKRFESTWLDSFHTGTAIMFFKGNQNDEAINMLGSYAYVTPEAEQHWGWRTEIEMTKENEMVITSYNISPEGAEAKATESILKRSS